MKKIFLVSMMMSSMMLMSGCEDIPGVLTVTKPLQVLVKGKTQAVAVGAHDTSLNFKRHKIVATIQSGSEKVKIDLEVSEGEEIPSNGNFELKSTQTGQPFDVLGRVATTVTESVRRTGRETCQYQVYDVVCGPKGCQTVPVMRKGLRTIEFFDRNTRQVMNFDMTEVGSATSSFATFTGQVNYNERIKTREGQCF